MLNISLGLKKVFVCFSIKAVYSELHHTIMSISEQDDLRWWKNSRGPGMPTDWPQLEVPVCVCVFTVYIHLLV